MRLAIGTKCIIQRKTTILYHNALIDITIRVQSTGKNKIASTQSRTSPTSFTTSAQMPGNEIINTRNGHYLQMRLCHNKTRVHTRAFVQLHYNNMWTCSSPLSSITVLRDQQKKKHLLLQLVLVQVLLLSEDMHVNFLLATTN